MKHTYHRTRLLLAALLLFTAWSARAQAWQPFRPGLIYSFSVPGGNDAHTLRLDSAYQTVGGDSAWAFGRLMRTSNGREQSSNPYGTYRKSRNNLFGARLVRQRSPAAFILENVAEGSFQAAATLQLRPVAAVGSSWAASTSPAITATLTSRTWQPVSSAAGSPSDSVAVITLSTGQIVRLSRSYGLLAGPQWLGAAITTQQWAQAQLPATVVQSPYYNPLLLFNLWPGDEMGYFTQPFTISSFPSSESYCLRRILSRRQTADSLLFTYQEQTRTNTFATPNGGTAGTSVSPVSVSRWAFSLRTGKSVQFPALPLLTGEYAPMYAAANPAYYVGRGTTTSGGAIGCGPSGQYLSFIGLFPFASAGQYSTGIDMGWRQGFSPALGMGYVFRTDGEVLTYYRRTLNSVTTSCGNPQAYVNLLPTRAAQAASIATLHPNPATERATLTLAQPARPGYTLQLTDALGRTVWTAPVPAGQTRVAVPLAGQPAGLYLLHLSGAETTATYKLNHE